MNARIIELSLMVFTIIILLVGLTLHYTNLPAYETFVKEDNFLEWLQFLFLFLTSLTCFYTSWTLKQINKKPPSIIFILAGLIFLFGAGEEISWGQRIFNIETPEYFEEYNAQSEMNLHNLTVMGVKINKLVFGKILGVIIILYMIVLPIVRSKNTRLRQLIRQNHIPTPRLLHILFFVALVGTIYILDPERKGELVEYVGITTFFLIVMYPEYHSDFQREVSFSDSESTQASEK